MNNLIKVSENIADEAEAIKGYIPLLEDKKIAGTVAEIIGDELAHLLMLTAILVESGGLQISADLKDSLDVIKSHIKA